MAATSPASILEALEVLDVAVQQLLDARADDLSCQDLIDVLDHLEVSARRLPVASQHLIARLTREATPADLDGAPLRLALAGRLLISPAEAKRRCDDAAALAPRVGFDRAESGTASAGHRGSAGPRARRA